MRLGLNQRFLHLLWKPVFFIGSDHQGNGFM
jgi:hypothetical protein